MKKEKNTEMSENLELHQTDFYTLDYIEKVWGISLRFLRDNINNGSLKAKSIGRRYFIMRTDLIAFMEKRDAKDKPTEG